MSKNSSLSKIKTLRCNRSVLRNLRSRETSGIGHVHRVNTYHHKTPSTRVFSCIPKRLAFSLKDLVEEHALMEEAHVFLGFNSNGTYVISYTESFGAIDQLGLPSYMYRLHWWLFRLGKKMIKVNSVRLFANEEITSSLQLYYAEWPQDKSKVLVYGCSKGSDVCYITVAAVPPIISCNDCDIATINNGGESSKCLLHGFVAHMTYSSVSSSSAVLNASGLQIDDLIVLNMGHSIGVISLGILPSHKDTECLPLSSIKRATFEEKPDISETEDFVSPPFCEKPNDAGMLLSPRIIKSTRNIFLSQSADCEINQLFKNNFVVSSEIQTSSVSSRSSQLNDWDSLESLSSHELLQPTSCIALNENQTVSDHCNCIDKYNDVFDFNKNSTKEDMSRIDPYVDPEPKSIVLLQRDCENTYKDAVELQLLDEESSSSSLSNKASTADKQSENCCCGYAVGGRCSEHDSVLQNRCARVSKTSKLKQDTINNESNKPFKISWDSVTKPQNYKQSSSKPSLSICGYCGLKIKEPKTSHKKKDTHNGSPVAPSRNALVGSPGRASSKLLFLSSIRNSKDSQDLNFGELNAPTPSPSASESSGSVYCTGDNTSQTSAKSGNYRKSDGILSFYETLYELSRDATYNVVDDNIAESSLFYGPVTFEGANGAPLHPVKSDSYDLSVAYSQHLVLDVEHVIFDVLRTRCYTTYKFGYLIDYDVQIIDTCSNTRSVVVLIVALLNVVPRKAKAKWQEHHYRLNGNFDTTASSRSQQFHFYICWQLQTGRYEVVAASPLHIFDGKKCGKWDAGWVLERRHAIRKACAIPQSGNRSVYVLSNSSVFRGKSLEYLWDVDRVIALKK